MFHSITHAFAFSKLQASNLFVSTVLWVWRSSHNSVVLTSWIEIKMPTYEPPLRRRRLSKGRAPPPLLPPGFAACVPSKATTTSRLSRELKAGVFSLWHDAQKDKKPASPRTPGASLLLRVEAQSREAWSIVSAARRQWAACAAGTVRKGPGKHETFR